VTARRLTFQLTPLLDLLLIVIFAQFMDVRETTQKQESEANQQIASATENLEAARTELDEISKELKTKRDAIADLETKSERVIEDRDTLKKALENSQGQRDAIAGLFPELFNVDEETMQKFIRQKEAEGVRLTKEQVEKLRQEFRRLSVITPQQAVEHLITYQEMLKRVDVWRIHVDARGVTKVEAGKNTIEFRAETARDFEREMIERISVLPRPKGVVVIMLSFGNVRLGLHEAVKIGLNGTTRTLNTLTDESKFYSAVVGLKERD
jgi:chromosome segregation ATPase